MQKYARLVEVLREEGIIGPEGLWEPEPADFSLLAAVHDPNYVRQVLDARVPPKVERVIGLPITRSVVERTQAAVGGTLTAARLALRHGSPATRPAAAIMPAPWAAPAFAFSTTSAWPREPCSTMAKSARSWWSIWTSIRAMEPAFIFEHEPRVFTFSMHGEKNFPVRRGPSDLDIDLLDGTGDEAYVARLKDVLPDLLQRVAPDLRCAVSRPGSTN